MDLFTFGHNEGEVRHMKRRWIPALLTGVAAGMTAALLLFLSGGTAAPDAMYRLAELDGQVAVYAAGDAGAPARLTPIRVRLLPAEDRLRLREGIPARDRRELAMLLEDLGS